MKRNRSFRQFLLIYLAAVVGVFVLAASIYELRNERNYKKVILQTRLEGYADRVALLGAENASFAEEVRITILEADGTVVYDSDEPDLAAITVQDQRSSHAARATLDGPSDTPRLKAAITVISPRRTVTASYELLFRTR